VQDGGGVFPEIEVKHFRYPALSEPVMALQLLLSIFR
jgi:hypothetical protein